MRVRAVATEGINHIVEGAFGANIALTSEPIENGWINRKLRHKRFNSDDSFWPMVFKKCPALFSAKLCLPAGSESGSGMRHKRRA